MAGTRRFSLVAQPDVEQILLEAQHRWLHPPEICELLRNHNKFLISHQPPNLPPSGSIFLFDRKVVRYFRNDGHKWRKKKDGKKVKESHEKLRVGSVNELQCYYAHGEDNENFQRRSYWMLQEELSNIVLVHYRDVKPQEIPNFQPREYIMEKCDLDVGSLPSHPSFSSTQTETIGNIPEQGHGISEQLIAKSFGESQEFGSHLQFPGEWQTFENDSASKCLTYSDLEQGVTSKFCEQDTDCVDLLDSFVPSCAHPQNQNDVQRQLPDAEHAHILQSDSETISNVEGKSIYSGAIKQHLLDCLLPEEGLRKIESSYGLMSEKLAGADVQFSSAAHRKTVETENRIDGSSIPTQPHVDTSMPISSLSEDQLCDIIDFTANGACVGSETETSKKDSSCLSKHHTEQKLYSDSAHDLTSSFCCQDIDRFDLLNAPEPSFAHPNKQNDVQTQLLMEEDLKKTESSNGLSSRDLEMLASSSSQDQLSSMIAFSPNWKYMGSEVEIAEIDFAHSSNWPMDHQLYPDSEENLTSSLPGIFSIISVGMPSCAHSDKENDHQTQLSDSEYEYFSESENDHQTQLSDSEYEYEYLSESENDHQTQFSDSEYEYFSELETDSNLTIEEHISVGSQADGGLSQELGDVTESDNGIDDSSIPAQKVFIMERFLKNQPEIIADTVLPCRVPPSESLHMRFGKLSLNSVATPNYNPGKIEPAQAETVLNWHSQNASARSSLQLRSLLDELRQKIQDLHQEILSLISLRQDFSRQEKEIKHLKIQLKSLERTLTERTLSDNNPWYQQTSSPDDLARGASASLFTPEEYAKKLKPRQNPHWKPKTQNSPPPVMKPTPIPDLYPPAQHMMEPSTNPITEYLRYYAYTETTPLQNLPIIYPTIGISSSEPTTDVSDSDSSSDSDHPLIFKPSTNPITEYLRYYAYTETTPLQNLPIIYPTIGISSSEPTTDVSDSDSSSDSDHPLIFMHQRSTSAAPSPFIDQRRR